MKELETLEKLAESFEKLPSIGNKTAKRLAYSILNMPKEEVEAFCNNLLNAKNNIHQCPICGMYTDKDICDVCSNIDSRDNSKIIVVATTKDALAIEKIYSNYPYHVLNGEISLLKNITPDKLNIESLLKRIEEKNIKEIIIATNPTIEGETTAQYLAKLLEDKPVTVTRLAYGLPMGGEIDYIDSLTISRAIDGRTKIKN